MYSRVFKILITEHGYSFLKSHYAPCNEFPNFPFYKARKILIEVQIEDPERENNAERIFRLWKNICAITCLIGEFPLRNLTIRFSIGKYNRHLSWPTPDDELIYSAELTISDLELLLQPFRLIRSAKATILLPWVTTYDGNSPPWNDHLDYTALHDWLKSKVQKRNTHPEAVQLIKDCESTMTNPNYIDYGDYERLRWTSWYFLQRKPNFSWVHGGRLYGWEELGGDIIQDWIARGKPRYCDRKNPDIYEWEDGYHLEKLFQ